MIHTLEFVCPRCEQPSMGEFYGPCHGCVAQLRDGQLLDQREAVVADYVPKMNVTPNAVATKD